VLSVRVQGGRPDSNGRRRDHDPEYLPLYDGHSGDGRARTCALAGNGRAFFLLDHAGVKEAEAAGLEPASGVGRLRASGTLPYQLDHASKKEAEGEGIEPPRPCGPTRFRDGMLRRWQPFR
jgi:hypothetical protein